MDIVEFAHGGLRYQEMARLRDLHLRQPLGLRMRAEDMAGEEGQRHFALMENGTTRGGLIAAPLGGSTAKLRQMWVDPALRGKGHGSELLAAVEARLSQDGTTRFILHARREAIGFYRRSGYRDCGEPFVEIGLPHVRMEKRTLK